MKNSDIEVKTWLDALKSYCYHINLSKYNNPAISPKFFKKEISGNRESTVEFENYFREHAPNAIEVWYEVAFWKLNYRWKKTIDRIIKHANEKNITARILWKATQNFIESPDISNLRKLREFLGLQYGIAVPLTFVSFASPNKYPMLDKKIALWVNKNWKKHSDFTENKLIEFKSYKNEDATYFYDSDLDAYLKWTLWCREIAMILSKKTGIEWRARDVEMAVFTAYDKELTLSVLEEDSIL